MRTSKPAYTVVRPSLESCPNLDLCLEMFNTLVEKMPAGELRRAAGELQRQMAHDICDLADRVDAAESRESQTETERNEMETRAITAEETIRDMEADLALRDLYAERLGLSAVDVSLQRIAIA